MTIELACVVTLLSSGDVRTRFIGLVLVFVYAWYSATWAATRRLLRALRDWDDRRGPPPTGA